MSSVTKLKPDTDEAPRDPLALLRAPFPANQVSKLPKESKNQREERQADRKHGVNCSVCGGWHHRNAVHLDYVGHAALTDRLLDADPHWSWEPLGSTPEGLPAFDKAGGLWIKLTIAGVSRYGYGSADGKSGGDAVKEIIGDALRNAAMRFGAALDLWHKGDLHADNGDDAPAPGPDDPPLWMVAAKTAIAQLESEDACGEWYRANVSELRTRPKDQADDVLIYLKARKSAVAPPAPAPSTDPFDDEIPF